jgi:hypothetical protein
MQRNKSASKATTLWTLLGCTAEDCPEHTTAIDMLIGTSACPLDASQLHAGSLGMACAALMPLHFPERGWRWLERASFNGSRATLHSKSLTYVTNKVVASTTLSASLAMILYMQPTVS